MKKFLSKNVTVGVVSLCAVCSAYYIVKETDFKNYVSSAFADSSNNANNNTAPVQNLYKEETVERKNIVVGITEMGTTSLANTGINYEEDVDISNVSVKVGQYVNKGDFIANAVLTYADDLYDEYVNEKENYSDQIDNVNDQIDNYNDQIVTYEKQIVNYENLILDYEEQIEDYHEEIADYEESLSASWKDHDKVLLDSELSKSDALKKLEENLESTNTLDVSYHLDLAEQELETAKMERDLQLLYDAHDELARELKAGYVPDSNLQNAIDDLASIQDEIDLVNLETEHAYICDRDSYVNYWDGCIRLSYEHDITKLATELASLVAQKNTAKLKITEAEVAQSDAQIEWVASMESAIAKALISIEDKEISIKEYNISLTNQAINTASNYKDAQYTVSTAQSSYDSTILQIENNIYTSEQKIKSIESNITKTEKSIENVYKNIDDVEADIAEVYEDIASVRTDIADANSDISDIRKDLNSVTLDSVDSTIVSPVSGYVVTISDEGTIRSGTDIISIGDSVEVQILVSISQDDIRDISIGMESNVVFDAYPDYTFRAEVDTISMSPASGMQTTVNYAVTILCDVSQFPDAVIYGGMTGDITFIQREKLDVIAISNKCIFTDDNGQEFVKIKNNAGEIETIPVTTGFSDGFDVEILSGLNEGDIVVIESAVSS